MRKALQIIFVLCSSFTYSQTVGIFGGDAVASGFSNTSNTSGKWLKVGHMTLNGNWKRASIMIDLFPRQSPHGDARQTLIVNLGNNTSGIDVTNQDIVLHHHYGVSRPILDVKVVRTSGTGVTNNTMSVWVQMGGSYIGSIPIEVRTFGDATCYTTHQPYYESIQETGTTYDAKVIYGMIGTNYHLSAQTAGDMLLSLEADKDNSNESDNTYIQMRQDGGTSGAYIGFNASWGNSTSSPPAGAQADNLFRIGTRYSGSDSFNRLVINSYNGNVGIGLDNPEAKLHVSSLASGDAVFKLESDTDNSNESDNTWIQLSQDGGSLGAYIGFNEQWGGSTTSAGAQADNLFRIGTRYSGSDSFNRLVINTYNGNVGIGTTNPSEKLEVAGTVYSREVKVEVAAGTGPDYVFEPDYELRTLAETEAYIKENKHLPEVASAKEMEANGVELGEMNMLLLKKVEELTLHLIEKEKELEELRLQSGQAIEALTKRIEDIENGNK